MDKDNQMLKCLQCTKRGTDKQKGLVCSITGEFRNFEDICPDFEEDFNVDKTQALAIVRNHMAKKSKDKLSPEEKKASRKVTAKTIAWTIIIFAVLALIRILIRYS